MNDIEIAVLAKAANEIEDAMLQARIPCRMETTPNDNQVSLTFPLEKISADITVDRGADGNPDVWIEIISDSGDFLAGDLTAQEAIRYLVRRNNDSRETA
mgnify:FL=1